ncbi:MAG: Lrp/AsnC family transcriptional regulator [Actinomycetota bacterium]|nr:Lrp/AsnC family transcriptional regulator [Actinomycetota bacterium]
MDEIDRRILGELRRDGRISWQQLGRLVHLSPNTVAERVRRLRRDGIIAGIGARPGWTALGRPLHALIDVKLVAGADRARFVEVLRAHPAVTAAHHATGRTDYVVAGHFTDLAELDDLLTGLKDEGIVADTETRLVLHTLDLTRDADVGTGSRA